MISKQWLIAQKRTNLFQTFPSNLQFNVGVAPPNWSSAEVNGADIIATHLEILALTLMMVYNG